jgi:hypothetical protein
VIFYMVARSKDVPGQLALDFSNASQDRWPTLLQMRQGRLTEDEARKLANNLDPNLAVGAKPFKLKIDRLLKYAADKGAKDQVLGQMSLSCKDAREYAVVIETLDFSALRGMLKYALEELEASRKAGPLPIDKMRSLLALGVPFNSISAGWSENKLRWQEDYLKGGSGYGRSFRISGDIEFPPNKAETEMALHRMGVDRVVARGGSHKRLDDAPLRQLHAVYAKKLMEERASHRRKELKLDEI